MESGLLAQSVPMTNSSGPVPGRTAGDYADAEQVLSTKKPTAPAGTAEDAGVMASRGRFENRPFRDGCLWVMMGRRGGPAAARCEDQSPRGFRHESKPWIPAKAGIQNRGARRQTGVPGQSMRGFRPLMGRDRSRPVPAERSRVGGPDGNMARRTTTGGCPCDSRRVIAGPANGAQEWKRSRVSPTKPSSFSP